MNDLEPYPDLTWSLAITATRWGVLTCADNAATLKDIMCLPFFANSQTHEIRQLTL